MALAEQYRPQTFDDVVGLEKNIKLLKWYLDKPANEGHVFLLSGASGVGKSSLATCAARYWGCSDFDIIKIESAECDVNALRDLSSNMLLCGWGGKGRKAYIIDEIHTVTGRARDRLLSILEAVPAHVCIFATTTETDWCEPALFSRWVRLDLSKPSADQVARHLECVAAAEGLPIPENPGWADRLTKSFGLNIRDQLNQLPARLLASEPATV